MILDIVVAGEPKAWQRPRHNSRTGSFFTPKDTLEYETMIAWSARNAKVRFGDREVIVHTDFFCKSKRAKDGDNMHKAVMDALQKAEVYDNDRQVVEGHWRLFRGVESAARTEIRVYAVDTESV